MHDIIFRCRRSIKICSFLEEMFYMLETLFHVIIKETLQAEGNTLFVLYKKYGSSFSIYTKRPRYDPCLSFGYSQSDTIIQKNTPL